LLAEILLLSGLDATDDPVVCGFIAGFLHLCFLSAFSWMLVEGIQVYNMLVKVFDGGRSNIWKYYLIGYGAPLLIVAISVAVVEGTGTRGYGTELYCWLDHRNGLIWAFAGPVVVVIGVNTFMFMRAMTIARKTMKRRKSALEETKKTLTLIKGHFITVFIDPRS
jgi:hypothetical protein